MGKNILITGVAGFVGSHVADDLLGHGYNVRILDNLAPQVHGTRSRAPSYLAADVEFIRGDVRDPDGVKRAVNGVVGVFHFAPPGGDGQRMYEIVNYPSIRGDGPAVLLEAIAQQPVERLVVAS